MILDREALKAEGVEGNWALGIRDVVRYRDLDTYNHVNNVVYHSWFEDVRVMFLERAMLKGRGEEGVMPVMRTADITFDQQLFSGAAYLVLVKPIKIGNSSFVLGYEVRSEGQVVVAGSSVIVMSDLKAGKSVPLSDEQRASIEAYL